MESKIVKLKCENCQNEEKQFVFSQLAESKKGYKLFFIFIWLISIGLMTISFSASLSISIKEAEQVIIANLTLLKIFVTSLSIFSISVIVRILQPYKIISHNIAICPICGHSWTLPDTEETIFRNNFYTK